MRTPRSRARSRAARPARSVALAGGFVLAIAAGPVVAAGNLSGSVDVSAVQTDIDGQSRSSVRQQHRLAWHRQVDPRLKVRLGITYFRFGLRDVESSTFWREDAQPSGEIIWTHPRFTLNANARRRQATALDAAQNVTNDDWSIFLRTRAETRPILTLRYDASRAFDRAASERDTRERRLLGAIDHVSRRQSITAQLEHRRSDNVVTDARTSRLESILRWDARPAPVARDRMRVSWSYTHQHTRRRDETISGDVILVPLSAGRGVYALDASPELGSLDTVSGLVDGMTDAPTSPPIDVGGDALDRNLGVDLGLAQRVAAVYVYTDRASGDGVSWRVFVSADNLSWRLVDGLPGTLFNATQNRYEIVFPAVETRYVKVVSGGFNVVETVYVTEVTAFEELGSGDPVEHVLNAHQADARLRYTASDAVTLSLDTAYRHVPSVGRASRDDYAYTTWGVYEPSEIVRHTLRWEQDFRGLGTDRVAQSTHAATYTAEVDPLPTARAKMSLRSRHGLIDHTKVEENNTASLQLSGTPVTGLDMVADVARSRDHDYAGSRRLDSWTFRVGGSAALRRDLNLDASVLRQRTTRASDDLVRTRTTMRVGLDLRLTRTILSRASLNVTDDTRRDVVRDVLVAWSLSPRVSMNAQAQINTSDGRTRSERYSLQTTYGMGSRGSLYAGIVDLDQTAVGGTSTVSFQQGFRIVF